MMGVDWLVWALFCCLAPALPCQKGYLWRTSHEDQDIDVCARANVSTVGSYDSLPIVTIYGNSVGPRCPRPIEKIKLRVQQSITWHASCAYITWFVPLSLIKSRS